MARALSAYYADLPSGYGCYSAHLGADETAVETSVLSCPDWLDLDCPLIATADRLTLAGAPCKLDLALDEPAAGQAAQRLAEILAVGVRLTDQPIFHLVDVNVRTGRIGGAVGVTRFLQYALTMDLLEGELIDAVTAGLAAPTPGSLPLRDRYLPDPASVLDVSGRLCAGGALALFAMARPADPHRGPADYVLLVQERSGRVVNAASRLAVIPKGLHQPLTDFRADARIGATLRREMEEELFGREDIDCTLANQRTADPMHPSRLSEPMAWLMADRRRLRMECTAFGLNLVSGNFEFAGLILIQDEEFWTRFGGHIAANWESSNIRQYSSLDRQFLTDLVHDTAWSNEGLFAMLQGLRRLAEIGGNRVDVPTIDWEMKH